MPKPAAWRAGEIAAYDALPAVSRCLFCPDWIQAGTAAEVREKAREHRLEAHPETFRRRKRSKQEKNVAHLASFIQPKMTPEEEEEVMATKERRMKLLGLL